MRRKKNEFNKELSNYIAKRRKQNPFRAPEGIYEPKKQPASVIDNHEVDKMDEDTTPEELANEYETERKGFFSKLFQKWFGVKEELASEEPAEQEQISQIVEKDAVLEDMRTIARIALGLSKQVPPERLSEFKQSQDFAVFKEILKKHGLIK